MVRGMRGAPKKATQPVSPEAMAAEISSLAGLPPKELKVAWSAEFRREIPKGMWRDLLLRTLVWRLGIRTIPRRYANGRVVGGGRFGKGGLNHLLKNRCYIGEVVHQGKTYTADHAPILGKELFEAVQAKLAANNVEKRQTVRRSPHLLTGLLFDSAGNRMTPSHRCKKGVRYRYYISQAILQSRKGEAGQVFRVPAPEIEVQIEQFVRLRAPDSNGDLRALIASQIARIAIQTDSISVVLIGSEAGADDPEGQSQTVILPWSRRPFRAMKGVVSGTPAIVDTPASRRAVLAAIGRARRWVDEIMAGGTIAEIARREGKGEHQVRLLMPLAFTPPATVRRLADGTAKPETVTECATRSRFPIPVLINKIPRYANSNSLLSESKFPVIRYRLAAAEVD